MYPSIIPQDTVQYPQNQTSFTPEYFLANTGITKLDLRNQPTIIPEISIQYLPK